MPSFCMLVWLERETTEVSDLRAGKEDQGVSRLKTRNTFSQRDLEKNIDLFFGIIVWDECSLRRKKNEMTL